MNKLNALHGEEPNEPPREWNIKTPATRIKYRTSPPKTSPVVSNVIGRLNYHAIDNGYVEVHPYEFPVEFDSESVPDPYTTSIKSINDDEMDHILAFFH